MSFEKPKKIGVYLVKIMDELESSLRRHGYVGDTSPAKLAYLTLVSALFDEPVSTLIRGASGAGKSHALKAAKRYVPAEAYQEFAGMSEKALVYLGSEVDLKHKTLIIQEAAGFTKGEGRAFLRQLLTEGHVRYATVNSTSDTGLKSEIMEGVRGPTGLIMTTTANALHHEDENRMLSVTVEHSPEEIRAALKAKMADGSQGPSDEELEPWHDAYHGARDYLEAGGRVAVPYGLAIVDKLKVNNPRLMRDIPKVITLIRTLALLQAIRKGVGADVRVCATLEDYGYIREIVEAPLAYGLKQSIPDGVRGVVEAVRALKDRSKYPRGERLPFDKDALAGPITQGVVAEYLGVDRGTVSRNIHKAVTDEYLIDRNPGQGRSADLDVGPVELPDGRVLPLPEELLPEKRKDERELELLAEELTPDFNRVR